MPTAQMTARVRIASMHPNVAGLALGRKRAAKLGSDIVKRVASQARISRADHALNDRRRNEATDGPLVRRYLIGGCPGGAPQAS